MSRNRGLETLKLTSIYVPVGWHTFNVSIQSFAPSLKKLGLHDASLHSAEDLVLLLSYFPGLEYFSFTQFPTTIPARYPKLDPSALANTQDRGVRLMRLKTFVVSSTLLIQDPGSILATTSDIPQ